MKNLSLVCSSFLAASLAAQTTTVSPTGFATVEGVGNNAFPFTNNATAPSRRYMQIHSDVTGPIVITKLSFRPNGNTTGFAGSAACDMEMFMGDSLPYDSPRWVLAQNYLGVPQNSLTRQVINWGPLAAGSPAPFEFNVPLTTPFVYTGAASLAWEAVVHSLTFTTPFATQMDVESSTITTGTTGTSTGVGCTVTGQASAMTLAMTHSDSAGTWSFGCTVANGPASAPAFLYLGVSNPNLSFPGLCSNLYTDLVLSLPLGATDANGYSGTFSNVAGTTRVGGGANAYALRNSVAGATLYFQAHALDISQPGIPIANSNGLSLLVPPSNLTRVRQVTRLFNNFGSTTATDAIYFNTSCVGYGIVTEFTH